MATSETAIANDMLIALGEAQISSITDSGKAGRLAARLLPLRRDELLRLYDWNCGRAMAALPALEDAPLFGFALQYQLPTDYLALRAVEDEEFDLCQTVAWEVQGRKVLTDITAPLNVTYTRQLLNTADMDSAFSGTLALRMAMDAALPLTGSAQIKASVTADFMRAIALARGSSYREVRRVPETDLWLASRRG